MMHSIEIPNPLSSNKSGKRLTAFRSTPPGSECNGLDLFAFTDYRAYLTAFYEERKAKNPNYSQSAFARKAGLGKNSRGYLKLITEGKRNLSPHTLRAFIDALGLVGRQALYFENLVYFNQAKTAKDKEYYFQRLSASVEGKESKQFELLRSQYTYCSHWYIVAVRELVALDSFQEDPIWIAAQLRNKITRKEASEALVHLERLGMIRRDEKSNRYVQSESLVKFSGGIFNPVIQKFHLEMLDRAKEALVEDEYSERHASAVTLSCEYARLGEMKKMVDDFRDQMTTRFGIPSGKVDTIFQIDFQIFQLTPVRAKKTTAQIPEETSK